MNPATQGRSNFVALMRKWGLAALLAAILEQGNAFSTLAAQSLYVATPVLETWISRAVLSELAGVMEDPNECARLIDELREVK